jgi:hypothetical protein
MNLQFLQENPKYILLKALSGSRAYGTDLPTSDTDIKGIFFLPKEEFYGLHPVTQVSDEGNDTVFFELGRCIELLAKNNPNLMELLATPADSILKKHPIMDALKPELFLSKLCFKTFAGYAQTQVQKARGLNKKILNPLEKERKSILDFCYLVQEQGSIKLSDWLLKHERQPSHCGLVRIDHMRDLYAVFYDPSGKKGYRGIQQRKNANEVALSTIPKGEKPVGYLSFNKDGYSTYCRSHREYWDWVAKRNDERYQNTLNHGKRYDAKNMMHTFRLLDMAEEIGREGIIRVRRPNRDELLAIRRGEFEYEALLQEVQKRLSRIEQVYASSKLPEKPDSGAIEALLVQMRKELYQ